MRALGAVLLSGCAPWFHEDLTAVDDPVAFTSVSCATYGAGCCGEGDDALWCWGSEPLGTQRLRDWCDGEGTYVDLEGAFSCTTRPLPVWDAFGDLEPHGVFGNGGGRCTLDQDGLPWCWGRDLGRFGRDPTEAVLEPDLRVPRPSTLAEGASFVELALGGQFTCALTAAGELWCWGRSSPVTRDAAEYGAQPFVSECHGDCLVTPRPRPGVTGWRHLAAGESHVCGLRDDGSVECLGVGPLGVQIAPATCLMGPSSPDRACAFAPVRIESTATFVAVEPTCALDDTGLAWCWSEGSSPQPVLASVPFVSIATSDTGGCGLSADGAASCWVSGSSAALVPGGRSFTALSVTGSGACGLSADASIACWGSGGSGAFGDGIDDPNWRSDEPVTVGAPWRN